MRFGYSYVTREKRGSGLSGNLSGMLIWFPRRSTRRRCRRTDSHRKHPTSNLQPPRRLHLHSDLRQGRGERDLDHIFLNADGTTGDGKVRYLVSFAGSHVELPSVPRAFHDVAGQMPFSQRPTRVGTRVIQGIEGSILIEE